MAPKKNKYPNMTATSIYKDQSVDIFKSDRSIKSFPSVEESSPRIEPYVEPQNYKQFVNHEQIVESNASNSNKIKHVSDNSKKLIKQNPAGVVVLTPIKEKPTKLIKPKRNQIIYYSSEDEENGQIKKVYKNVNY